MAPPAAKAPPAAEPEEDAGEAFGSWEGERNEESLPHGKGKATYPNGDTFSGVIKNSYREGKGSYVWKELEEGKSGGVYDGDYDSNKKHGKGVMKYPDTGTYDGPHRPHTAHPLPHNGEALAGGLWKTVAPL